MVLQVQPIRQLSPVCLSDLLRDSRSSGFRAVQRLIDEWTSGVNQFGRSGEALFIARWHDRIVGVCGLNIDPYATITPTGRVRRLYVLQAYRRQGIGRALVKQVIAEACLSFDRLHVRTDSLIADRFYRSLGFTPCSDNRDATHSLDLSQLSNSLPDDLIPSTLFSISECKLKIEEFVS